MTPDAEPRTPSGYADHDRAWNATSDSRVAHDHDREGCGGCAFIAKIEAEAANGGENEARAYQDGYEAAKRAATPADSLDLDAYARAVERAYRGRIESAWPEKRGLYEPCPNPTVLWDRLGATPADSLDVERLAHAYNNITLARGFGAPLTMPTWRAVAAEYAALRAEGSSKPPEPRHSGIALWDPVRGARPYSDDDPALSGSSKPDPHVVQVGPQRPGMGRLSLLDRARIWLAASDRDTQIERIAAALHGAQVGCEPFTKPEDSAGWPGGHPFIMHRSEAAALYDAGLRVEPDAGALRAALEYGPEGVVFPNLPHHPTGPDILEAVAFWMDGVDRRDGNTKPGHDDVQKHLRKWAAKMRAALAASPTVSAERTADT